jgi:class 3 adenylate cyclase
MATCASCRASLPAGARFCPACAHPVAEPTALGEERKLATVLFADLVDSTELADAEDPERTRAMLSRFYDAMAGEVIDGGGTVDKFMGDAVMAVFGAPTAQEDHAERALHAALSMLRRLEQVFGGTLSLRIGVNTGDVIVGNLRESSSFVTGDAVNVAARLEAAARPGEILIGVRTVAAVGEAFEVGEPVSVEAKGKAGGVVCHRLIRALSPIRPRGIRGLRHFFVGREHEIEALERAYGRVVEEAQPRLVTIIGEAGVGKTTLTREFSRRLGSRSPEPLRRVGRCSALGAAVAYKPLGDIVREHFGLLQSDSVESVRDRLGRHEILGLTLGMEAPAGLHPLAAQDRLHQAWVGFLEELVAERPAVVLVEDLHSAEEALLNLLEAALQDVRGPLLLLGTARPELVHHRPTWGGRGSDAETLWLEALSPADASRLIDELLPAELPRSFRDVVVMRAEGNPFFIEELLRALIDQGAHGPDAGDWTRRELSGDLVVPDTLQAVLAARIDLLGGTEKAGLQAASVIGRTFWSGPVYELLEGLEPDFRLLEERDFVRHRARSSIVGEREFAITHALTRDVAYGSLSKARRARLHARFAGWLELAGEGRDEYAALLAHHYAQAVRPEDADLAWQAEDAELGRLGERAVVWLRRAAALAVGRYDITEGLALLHRAVDLETSLSVQCELWQEIAHANALYFDGGAFSAAMQRAIELAEESATIADLYSELAFQTLVRAGMWAVAPETALVGGWVDRVLELAQPNSVAQAKALIARGYSDYEKSPELANEATRIAESLGDPGVRSYSYDIQGLRAFAQGNYEEAAEWYDRRLSLVAEITDPDHHADIYAAAIAPAVARGRLEDARRYAALHGEVTRGLSPHHRLHGVSVDLELDEVLGDWRSARARQPLVEDAVRANRATPCLRNRRSLLVCALASAHLGDGEESRRLEQEAQAHRVAGFGLVVDTPRLQLALQRHDLAAVESFLGEPAVRRANWFYLSSMAAHMDGLAALGARARVEDEARRLGRPGVYLQPFVLRALGLVRDEASLLERAATEFEAAGLSWHAAQTRALL